jgi:hypothetical protein
LNAAGACRIRYKRATGATPEAPMAPPQNRGKSACWDCQFTTAAGAAMQPAVTYCR